MVSATLTRVFFIYLCYISDLSNVNFQAPGVYAIKSEKIGACSRCKVLTDSFNHWLDKTSRGKYEGGDTAWEEAKLKSYSRSEICLIEVQEGLCSELSKYQNDCYKLAEEAEQLLENWWFHEDPSTSDLQTWLCIETLKNCCPNNHFGESCEPCPLDKANKICSGHGRCDGEGTRNGNGTCICNRGFTGHSCEECLKSYYEVDGSCERCNEACEECTGPGPDSCLSCKAGWFKESGICVDIDECLLPLLCKSDQYCINKEGSYKCNNCDESCKSCMGIGPCNCTTCEPESYLWNGKCIADTLKAEIVESAVFQLTIYIGMLLALGILYKIHKYLSFIALIIFAFYIYYNEKSLEHASTFDVYFNNFGGTAF